MVSSEAVPGVESADGELATSVTLYRLNDLPAMIKVFLGKSQDLLLAVQKIADGFNPRDKYWNQDA